MTTVADLLIEFREKPRPSDESPVLTLTERNGFVRQSERFNKRLATEDVTGYKVVRRNDIAFNPYLLWAGAVAQNTIVDEGIISPLYPTFRVREGHDPRFVARLLLTPQLIDEYDAIAFGSVPRRRRSSVKDFLGLQLDTVPPLVEQQRIAEILDRADAIRAKRRQVLAHLDSLTQSIFHDLFGNLAQSTTVGDVAEVQGGLQVSARRAQLPLEVPYLRVANTHRGRLDLSEVKTLRVTQAEAARTRLMDGDLLFVEGHANPEEVGRVAMWTGAIDGCVHQNHLIRARIDPSQAIPVFAETWLNTHAGAAHFRRAGRTTSGLNTISASTVRTAPMPLPPLASQQQFAARIERVNAQRAAVQRALAADDELFASLQSRAFRGEL